MKGKYHTIISIDADTAFDKIHHLFILRTQQSGFRKYIPWGTWVAQSVKHPTLAQVMISQFVSSSPTSGSVLTAQSLETASHSVSPSVSAPSLIMLCLCLKNK